MARSVFKFSSELISGHRVGGREWTIEKDGASVGYFVSVLAPPHRWAPDNEWRVSEYEIELWNGKSCTITVAEHGTARKALAAAKAWARSNA